LFPWARNLTPIV